MKRPDLACIVLLAMLVNGCARGGDSDPAGNNAGQPPAVEALEEPDSIDAGEGEKAGIPTDEWVGRWNGPEGLFLDIQPSPNGKAGHYAITNRDNLDREADYDGVAQGAAIRFMRDGQPLTIRAGSGEETGFKYLAGKQDCLILVPNREGYCR